MLATVGEANDQSLRAIVGRRYDGHDRGKRNDPDRERVALHQRVDQRAFATLELAQHDDVEAVLRHPQARRSQIVPLACREQRMGERAQLIQRAEEALTPLYIALFCLPYLTVVPGAEAVATSAPKMRS